MNKEAREALQSLSKLIQESYSKKDKDAAAELFITLREQIEAPIPMILTCPSCNNRHIDKGDFAIKVHHTHACQYCGMVWRPAIGPTVGVQFLPGFKDEE